MKIEEVDLSEKFLSIYVNNTVLLALRTPHSKHVTNVEVAKMYTVRSKSFRISFLIEYALGKHFLFKISSISIYIYIHIGFCAVVQFLKSCRKFLFLDIL